MLKLDIMKAYDSLNWKFLFGTLEVLEFPDQFINWIKVCVTTALSSVNPNGSLAGYFKSGRGLRQGDPVSPYLVLLCMEMFSATFAWNIETLGFDFHPRCQELQLSHFVFADDLFFISAATAESFDTMKKTVDEFGAMSGLLHNLQKCRVYTAGLNG